MNNRENYNWRPNDNSASTRIKYDLEAEHWVRSLKSAEYKYRPRSISADLKVVGLIFQLLGAIVFLVYALVSDLIKWMRA